MGLFLAKQYINSEANFIQTDTTDNTYTSFETTGPVTPMPKVQRTWFEKIVYGYK